jgi:hypothetical protein
MPQWEYLDLTVRYGSILRGDPRGPIPAGTTLGEALATVGTEGWELVAIDPNSPGHDASTYIFKRPKQ